MILDDFSAYHKGDLPEIHVYKAMFLWFIAALLQEKEVFQDARTAAGESVIDFPSILGLPGRCFSTPRPRPESLT